MKNLLCFGFLVCSMLVVVPVHAQPLAGPYPVPGSGGGISANYAGAVTFTNPANVFGGAFTGDGSRLTNTASGGGVTTNNVIAIVNSGQTRAVTNNQPSVSFSIGSGTTRFGNWFVTNQDSLSDSGGIVTAYTFQTAPGGSFVGDGSGLTNVNGANVTNLNNATGTNVFLWAPAITNSGSLQPRIYFANGVASGWLGMSAAGYALYVNGQTAPLSVGQIYSDNYGITSDGSGNLTAVSFAGGGSALTGITAGQVGAAPSTVTNLTSTQVGLIATSIQPGQTNSIISTATNLAAANAAQYANQVTGATIVAAGAVTNVSLSTNSSGVTGTATTTSGTTTLTLTNTASGFVPYQYKLTTNWTFYGTNISFIPTPISVTLTNPGIHSLYFAGTVLGGTSSIGQNIQIVFATNGVGCSLSSDGCAYVYTIAGGQPSFELTGSPYPVSSATNFPAGTTWSTFGNINGYFIANPCMVTTLYSNTTCTIWVDSWSSTAAIDTIEAGSHLIVNY